MTKHLDPLPLERNRPRDEFESAPPRKLKITSVDLVSHIGLCLTALSLPIFLSLFGVSYRQPINLAWFGMTTAAVGAVAMLVLTVLCVGLMRRKAWARVAVIGWATFMMIWESLKLLVAVFYYAPLYSRLMTESLTNQLAAATQPTSRPTQFDSFVNYGIYIMAVMTWLIFFGFAFGSKKAMNTPAAKAGLQS